MKVFSLKLKFVISLSLLMIVIFSAAGYYLIQTKKTELSNDIYIQSFNFTKLTTTPIVKDYKLFYDSGYATFKRNLESNLALNEDIANLKISTYGGELVFDYGTEKDNKYRGEARSIDDSTLLERIKDVRPSIKTVSGREVYYNLNQGTTEAQNGNPTEVIKKNERIETIIYPFLDNSGQHVYSVIFNVSYDSLTERIRLMTITILVIVGVALLLSTLFAITLASKIIGPIKMLKEGAESIARGNLKTHIVVKTRDELKLLGDTMNKMAQDLDKSIRALVDKQRMEKELELAASIQKDLLPSKLPTLEGLEVVAHTIPAGEVGGDSYDFITIDQHKTVFYIGDVTGHGVPSGLVMAIANALIYTLSKIYHTTREIVVNTNRVLHPKTKNNLFMTLCLYMWDAEQKKLSFTGAGHEPFIYFRKSENKIYKIKSGGMLLGSLPDIDRLSQEQVMELQSGDLLVMYTDGVTEALNEAGDAMFEMQRLEESVMKYSKEEHLLTIFKGILTDLQKFMGKATQRDDVTLIVIRRK